MSRGNKSAPYWTLLPAAWPLQRSARPDAHPLRCGSPRTRFCSWGAGHNLPRGLARFLPEHTVEEAKTRGWDTLTNGELLNAAEKAGFDLLLTADQGIAHQQNFSGRRIAIIILGKGQWPFIKPVVERVVVAVNAAQAGTITLVEIPFP